MTSAKRFFISGRVQGVYFRASTRAQATALGLQGYAVNRPDGRVEVLAVGSATALEQLTEWLQHGPRAAKVLQVDELAAEPAELSGQVGFSCG